MAGLLVESKAVQTADSWVVSTVAQKAVPWVESWVVLKAGLTAVM